MLHFMMILSLKHFMKENQKEIWHTFFISFYLCDVFIKGRNGRAFLFSHAMNVIVGPKEDRQLMTGLHTVADVYCGDCREILGWKYEKAYEETQKYKEGKFILEKSKIVKENW
ncbi:UNVERIFIED_CONTAM: protein yippee-like [Sesamum angustifolium]|uniref:Protein yippee-like n=1 Tax=Sesamum angustifolium TaxID=2727405 RepID=A0AAW2MMH9_9LAMI